MRRIKIEERFRPVKASDQILVVFVFDNLPKPSVGVKPICESFPVAFSEMLRGLVRQNLPELGAIILYQADPLNHHVVDLPLSVL